MSLPNSIATDASRLLDDINEFSRWLNELKPLLPTENERACQLYANARCKIIAMRNDVGGIICAVQADRMTGQANGQVPVPPHMETVPREVEEKRAASAKRGVVPVTAKRDRHEGHSSFDWMMAAANDHSLEEGGDGA